MVVCTCAAVWADADTVELNVEQRKLNNQAIAALNADPPDPDNAAKLVQAALLMGEKSNVLFLTLGRAHQLAGRCSEAEEAYQQALRAPMVQGVPRSAVIVRYDRYREEMLQSCPGYLFVHCSSQEIELVIAEDQYSCDDTIELMPGDYVLQATLGEGTGTEISFSIESMERTRLQVVLGTMVLEDAQREVRGPTIAPQDMILYAINVADDEQKRSHERMRQEALAAERRQIEEERKRLEREQIELERQRLEDERRRIAEQRDRLTQDQASAHREREQDDSESTKSQATSPRRGQHAAQSSERLDMSEESPVRGWHGQVQATVPFGGFAVRGHDGFADGGLLYGATAAANLGFGFSYFMSAELFTQFNWLAGEPLGMKAIKGRDELNDQKIGFSGMRFLGELRGWFGFLGPAAFVEYRWQSLGYGDKDIVTPTLLAGPSLSFAANGLYRQDGYVMITGRWAPFIDGNNDIYTFEVTAGSGYAQYSVEYSRLTGEHYQEGALRTGEMIFFNVGFRVPYRF